MKMAELRPMKEYLDTLKRDGTLECYEMHLLSRWEKNKEKKLVQHMISQVYLLGINFTSKPTRNSDKNLPFTIV